MAPTKETGIGNAEIVRRRSTEARREADIGSPCGARQTRDPNLRHASIATTSTYLHSDDVKRAPDGGGVRRSRLAEGVRAWLILGSTRGVGISGGLDVDPLVALRRLQTSHDHGNRTHHTRRDPVWRHAHRNCRNYAIRRAAHSLHIRAAKRAASGSCPGFVWASRSPDKHHKVHIARIWNPTSGPPLHAPRATESPGGLPGRSRGRRTAEPVALAMVPHRGVPAGS